MKRLTRRWVAVTIGLVLGWLAQGWTAGFWLQPNEVHAEETVGDAHGDIITHVQGDSGVSAASKLTNAGVLKDDMGWYKNVVLIAAGLFVAAIVIGVPVSRMNGTNEDEDAASHDAVGAH